MVLYTRGYYYRNVYNSVLFCNKPFIAEHLIIQRQDTRMNRDFLKTDTPEIWTKEQYRNEQFMKIEFAMFDSERVNDYQQLIKLARMYLRLQMEVMEEKHQDEKGKKYTLMGKDTHMFQTIKAKIDELELQIQVLTKHYSDPAMQRNATESKREVIIEINELLDQLFHNNTVLGLNYKKKNDPMKAAYG
jgi:hypothetical protein